MLWLFEKDTFDEGNPERMQQICRARGFEAHTLQYAAFGGGLTLPRGVNLKQPTVVYGSLNLVRYLKENPSGIRPGVWTDWDVLRCQSYYAHWGEFMVQREYVMLPLAEIPRRKEFLFRTLGDQVDNPQVFIRPDDNIKSFHGELVAWEKFDRWYKTASLYEPGSACLCVVARPEKIAGEWRFVVADRKVATGTGYRAEGRQKQAADYPPEAAAFAEMVIGSGEFNPLPVYTMDICWRANGEYRLLEIGAFNGAGLYDCDMEKVIEAVSQVAERDFKGG